MLLATQISELPARLATLAKTFPGEVRTFGYVQTATDYLPLDAFFCGDMTHPVTVIAAGVHGDEPEGILALLDWLIDYDASRQTNPLSLIILPCLNPTGLALGTRTNAAGQDINRQFHADALPETAALRRLLAPYTIRALIDLHTDPRATGFYLFELLHEGISGCAHAIQQFLSDQNYPLEAQPSYAGGIGKDGLFIPTPAMIAGFERHAPGQGLAEWAWHREAPRSYVFETPRAAGLEMGARMHREALNCFLRRIRTKAA